MELHQLRSFVTVAETGHFSRAARQIGIAQPSLSQQIQRLEESLGTSLFDRLGRTIALTDAGHNLLPRARRILAEVRDAAAAAQSGEVEGGTLRIGAIPTMAPYLLPRALKRFRRIHPKAQFTVREDLTPRLVDAVVECELDCAVMSAPIDHELIDLETIGTEPLLVATSAKELTPHHGPWKLEDLRDRPTVVLHEMHCLGQQIQSFCSAQRVAQRIICRTTQLATVLELVALGLGVSLVPSMCAEHDRTRTRVYAPLGMHGPVRAITLAWRTGRSRPRLAQDFAAILRENLAGRNGAE